MWLVGDSRAVGGVGVPLLQSLCEPSSLWWSNTWWCVMAVVDGSGCQLSPHKLSPHTVNSKGKVCGWIITHDVPRVCKRLGKQLMQIQNIICGGVHGCWGHGCYADRNESIEACSEACSIKTRMCFCEVLPYSKSCDVLLSRITLCINTQALCNTPCIVS